MIALRCLVMSNTSIIGMLQTFVEAAFGQLFVRIPNNFQEIIVFLCFAQSYFLLLFIRLMR
jgi:hypothetical protein